MKTLKKMCDNKNRKTGKKKQEILEFVYEVSCEVHPEAPTVIYRF